MVDRGGIGQRKWAILERNQKGMGRGWWKDIFFENPPGGSRLLTLAMEFPDETKLHPWKFCKVVLYPLEISMPKTKTRGSST